MCSSRRKAAVARWRECQLTDDFVGASVIISVEEVLSFFHAPLLRENAGVVEYYALLTVYSGAHFWNKIKGSVNCLIVKIV